MNVAHDMQTSHAQDYAQVSAFFTLSAVALSCAARTYLYGRHSVPTCFQDDAYTACCHPLSQPADNASSDQNILHCKPI